MAKRVSALHYDEEFCKKAFETIDKNGDGFLNDDEIEEFITSVCDGGGINTEEFNEFKRKIADSSRGCLAGKFVYQVIFSVTFQIVTE